MNLRTEFQKRFGFDGDIREYFAPGRVNLIGEHTDYNGGHVFPCSITIGTYLVARKRNDRKLRFYSENFPELGIIESSLDQFCPNCHDNWTEYPMGMMWTFEQHEHMLSSGYDLFYYGNIPNGAGLSSSSSIDIVTGCMLADMNDFKGITSVQLALLGQYAENHYNGLNCGIMDQFAIANGKKDQAMFLDTATLTCEYVPVQLKNAKILIAYSNKKRALTDSKYNERRGECEEALAQIQTIKDINSLGDLTNEEFELVSHVIKRPVCVKRARHAVAENQRTITAVTALKDNNIEEFGKLMNASHISLRDDYEVTGIELDTLVEEAWKCPGVIGSRMTGAGFGGCTISIVEDAYIDQFIENVGNAYEKKIGYAADFYTVEIGDGARRLS